MSMGSFIQSFWVGKGMRLKSGKDTQLLGIRKEELGVGS